MALDTTRIAPSIDAARMKRARVVLIGVGGAANLAIALIRSGLGAMTLIDPDEVGEVNLVRQEYDRFDVGQAKVATLRARLKRISLEADVLPIRADVTRLDEETSDGLFRDADLIIAATDSFAAQSRANRLALKHRKPTLWPGVYAGGLGGEIVFWRPGLPCYRCLLPSRYRAQDRARVEGRSEDPPSDGSTIFETGLVDAIVGQLAVGLLTRGADDRYGRLIDKLGDRNFLHVKLDPEYRFNGRDVVREQLGVAEDNDRFFAWNVAARRDPDGGRPPCPDCIEFGHAANVRTEEDRVPGPRPSRATFTSSASPDPHLFGA